MSLLECYNVGADLYSGQLDKATTPWNVSLQFINRYNFGNLNISPHRHMLPQLVGLLKVFHLTLIRWWQKEICGYDYSSKSFYFKNKRLSEAGLTIWAFYIWVCGQT